MLCASPATIDRDGLHKTNLRLLAQALAALRPCADVCLVDGFRLGARAPEHRAVVERSKAMVPAPPWPAGDQVGMSNAIALSDAGDYAGALTKMAPVVARYPNSVVVKVTYDEMKRRATNSTKQKAKSRLNGLIKKKWP